MRCNEVGTKCEIGGFCPTYICAIRIAHAPSSPGCYTLPQDFLIFGLFLFEIVIVGCSLPVNGTFGHPEVVLGDNETGYPKTGLLDVPKLCLGTTGQATQKRDVWSH
ncbi:hypothetical protein AVEN_119968-1 [Araneus ventricosus]|uniref:Uncharacterized protein n=1 Tax=Araneus ventricosus TaxID=182803 RepID=A0A4Y2GD06_ARAVE|nr:hypothetical protein AVEN_67435-1 [Araneus ventricosus]GBM51702.1 hypothetical protein AVEN_119968-1 [Araneus ventricosus]